MTNHEMRYWLTSRINKHSLANENDFTKLNLLYVKTDADPKVKVPDELLFNILCWDRENNRKH